MVEKPRNGGTWTEAAYWGRVRGALRKTFAAWVPMREAMKAARREYTGPNKRQKWEYLCAECLEWWKGSEVQVDHIEPCGSLKCSDDLAWWLERLTPEDPAAFQVLCKPCHKQKTQRERKR